ncbi:MAG TPA: hypothetical protein VMB18_04235 [Terriglobales bacterium]|jgi:hypothetical protein|nr:hypothetical protein [Terriglobales bacterium]
MTTDEEVMAEIHRVGMARCFDAFFLRQCGIAPWDAEDALDALQAASTNSQENWTQ